MLYTATKSLDNPSEKLQMIQDYRDWVVLAKQDGIHIEYHLETLVEEKNHYTIDDGIWRYMSSFKNRQFNGLIVQVEGSEMRVGNGWAPHYGRLEPIKIKMGDYVTIINTIDTGIELKRKNIGRKIFKIVDIRHNPNIQYKVEACNVEYWVNPYNIQPVRNTDIEVHDVVRVEKRYYVVRATTQQKIKTSGGWFKKSEVALYRKSLNLPQNPEIDLNKKVNDLFALQDFSFVERKIDDFSGYNVPQVLFKTIINGSEWYNYVPIDMVKKGKERKFIGLTYELVNIFNLKVFKTQNTNKVLKFSHEILPAAFLIKSKKAKNHKPVKLYLVDEKYQKEFESYFKNYRLIEIENGIKTYVIDFESIKHMHKFLTFTNKRNRSRHGREYDIRVE